MSQKDIANKGDRKVLLFSCSGGSNVAEISDRAARQLMFEGHGSMFCLAGLGAQLDGMVQTAKGADVNLVIDGCPLDCGKKIFEKVGIGQFGHVRVTDLGVEKVKGVRATDEQVAQVVAKAEGILEEK